MSTLSSLSYSTLPLKRVHTAASRSRTNTPVTFKSIDEDMYNKMLKEAEMKNDSKLTRLYQEVRKTGGNEKPVVESTGEYVESYTRDDKVKILQDQLQMRLWQEKQLTKQLEEEDARKQAAREVFEVFY